TTTTTEPHSRYLVIERCSRISTPMFSGTSTPSRASTASPKNVQLVKFRPCSLSDGRQVLKFHGFVTAWLPLARYTTPATNMAAMASPYSRNTMLTRFWVTRNRSTATIADTKITPTMIPPCAWIDHVLIVGKAYARKDTVDTPVATITSTPGHQAQNPAKKPQNAPNALCVHR